MITRQQLIKERKLLMERDLEYNKNMFKKKATDLFNEGKSSLFIASKFNWFYPPTSKGYSRPLPNALNIIVTELIELTWEEYKLEHHRIVSRIRYDSGFTTKMKEIIKNRDGGCIVCGTTNNLHVHHIDLDKTNNSKSNLVTVCAKLHNIIHSAKTIPNKENEWYWKPRITLLKEYVNKIRDRRDLNKVRLIPRKGHFWFKFVHLNGGQTE